MGGVLTLGHVSEVTWPKEDMEEGGKRREGGIGRGRGKGREGREGREGGR